MFDIGDDALRAANARASSNEQDDIVTVFRGALVNRWNTDDAGTISSCPFDKSDYLH
jgi:hypothetical protein